MVALGIVILSVSLLLQTIAAFLAFRLIRITGKRKAWILISTAILLMAVRRSIPLFRVISGDTSYLPDLTNELVGLVLSTFMVTGAAWIAPLFVSIKHSEEAARESREWLFTTLKSIGDAVIATNINGYITFMNPTAQVLTGHKEEEAVGRPLSEIFIILDGRTGEPKEEPVSRVIRAGDVVSLDNNTILEARNGVRLIIDDSAAPIKDEKGNIIGVVLVFRDVTDRKRAEDAIKVAHRQLDQIFNAAADGMRVIDRDFNMLRINDTFTLLAGQRKVEMAGKKCFEVFPGTTCHTPDCPLTRIMGGEEHVEYDVEKWRINGDKITCIMTATPFRSPEGELIGIVEDFKDITERKRTEELLRQGKVAREERQRLFAVLDVLPAIVYLQSPDYSIPFANRAFREIFDDPKGKRCFEILHGLQEPCADCRIAAVLLHEQEILNRRLTAPDGRIYEMYDTLFTDIDNSRMILELGIDITDRIQMEKARKEAERQLEEQRARAIVSDRLRSLGEMATGMAHELNQPLLGIRGLAEHILIGFKRGWNIPEAMIKEKIQLIVDQTDRMTHVIEHARLFARGSEHTELLPVQVNEAIKSCMELIGAQLRFRGFILDCELAEDLPPVLANPFSLEEVVLNLINNARDAVADKLKTGPPESRLPGSGCPERSSRIVVRTFEEKSESGSLVKIEVIDHGVGIPQNLIPKVFETFFTTKDPDKGTGLGLTISRSIVESFQGTISIQSVVNQGTAVTVTLPAMRQKPGGINYGG
ncbi:MAG: PAS domain S-box protein [bacterium]